MRYPLSAFVKRPHRPGCEGDLYRRPDVVCVDVIGRIGNGGWVAHDYRCNLHWDGCPARVLVTETEVRLIAVRTLRWHEMTHP